jgi:kumamolisin
MSRGEFAAAHAASVDDVRAILDFAKQHGLEVTDSDAARRCVCLAGSSEAMSRAFGVKLHRFEGPRGSYRGRVGSILLPPNLRTIVTAVLGLDDRPQAQPHFRPAVQTAVTFTPLDLARTYDFPPGDGAGSTLAIIEMGGGFVQADLDTYFQGLGLTSPAVEAVSVDGATNAPTGQPDGPDGEVMLDLEVAGALVPKVHFAVYFAPNTDRGFYDAVSAAVHDAARHPIAVSISWGGPEASWTRQAMKAMDALFADAAAMGVTITCASGDNGSGDGETDSRAHADFPSSSPNAIGCGGTRLTAKTAGGVVESEVAWNDGGNRGATGGGISDVFALPSWQAGRGVPPSVNPGGRVGRGVPDVAADADPATGYRVRIDGSDMVFGGTSAVAPLWAALAVRLGQQLGTPAGFLNPLLYSAPTDAFRDITSGSNGAYRAKRGWDACTGLGSANGSALLEALRSKASPTIGTNARMKGRSKPGPKVRTKAGPKVRTNARPTG